MRPPAAASRIAGMRRPLSLLPLALLASCATYRDTIPIHFSSDPPGADVLIDGVPSGMATPCMIALPKKEQVVSLKRNGYVEAKRRVFPDPYTDTWYWSEATVGPHTWDFFLLINLDDTLQPYPRRNELLPKRIFVRLERLSDQ